MCAIRVNITYLSSSSYNRTDEIGEELSTFRLPDGVSLWEQNSCARTSAGNALNDDNIGRDYDT